MSEGCYGLHTGRIRAPHMMPVAPYCGVAAAEGVSTPYLMIGTPSPYEPNHMFGPCAPIKYSEKVQKPMPTNTRYATSFYMQERNGCNIITREFQMSQGGECETAPIIAARHADYRHHYKIMD